MIKNIMKTSRVPLWDIVELIANLIASVSHLQELVGGENETQDNKDRYNEMILELVDIRRAVMDQLPKWDTKLRCNIKHAIAQRGYALEIYYAERTDFWKEVVDWLSKYMYKILSEYLGMEITDCWRCLNDMIKDLDTNKKDEKNTI